MAFSIGTGKKIQKAKWEEELGDTLYSLISLMNELDIDAEKALIKVIEKYEARFTKKNAMDSVL